MTLKESSYYAPKRCHICGAIGCVALNTRCTCGYPAFALITDDDDDDDDETSWQVACTEPVENRYRDGVQNP